jgi:hypothetical protein
MSTISLAEDEYTTISAASCPDLIYQRAEIIYIHIFPVICTINANISARCSECRSNYARIHWQPNSWRIMLVHVLQRFDRREKPDSLALFTAIISSTKRENEQSRIFIGIFTRIFG